jgi:hypothetical protein
MTESTHTNTNTTTKQMNDLKESQTETIEWEVVATDTYGGQANYSHVVKETLHLPRETSNRQLARFFKEAVGYTNSRGRSAWVGEMYEFRPYNECMIIYATPKY